MRIDVSRKSVCETTELMETLAKAGFMCKTYRDGEGSWVGVE